MTTKSEKKSPSRSFDSYFQKKLTDPEFCKGYVNSALEEIDDPDVSEELYLATLIDCLRNIILAHGSVDKFIEKFDLSIHRSTLYKLFDYTDPEKRKNGPEFMTLQRVLRATCGARFVAV